MSGTAGVVSAISTVVAAGGSVYKGLQAASDRDRAQDQLKKEGKQAKKIHKDRTKRLLASQRAAYGASGVRVGEGTPLEVVEQTREDAQKERDAIMKGYKYKGDVLSREEDRFRLGGFMEGAGTLLQGGAKYGASPYAKNPFAGARSRKMPYIPAL